MKWINTKTQWGWIAQIFHWGMFFLILGQLTLAWIMTELEGSPLKMSLYTWHKQIGLTLLFIVFLRLWWREVNLVPKKSKKAPQWSWFLSLANIWILYFIMFSLPLSGLLMSILGGHSVNYFDLFTISPLMEGPNVFAKFFHAAHHWIPYTLYLFVTLHILGAIFHHFIVKDDILIRILPRR